MVIQIISFCLEEKKKSYSSVFFLYMFDGKPESTNSPFQKERKKNRVRSVDLDVLGKEIRMKL